MEVMAKSKLENQVNINHRDLVSLEIRIKMEKKVDLEFKNGKMEVNLRVFF
jgi:hypothetical protein